MKRINGYMDQKVIVNLRNGRSSPSTDRFLGVFSPPTSDYLSGDELNEDDVFWTGDFAEKKIRPESRQSTTVFPFKHPEKFGILAALAEDGRKLNQNRSVLYRRSSISPSESSASRLIPVIPKPEREYSQSMPFKKFQQSAPVNVPLVHNKLRNFDLPEVDVEIDEEEEMLPPHEIVAKGSRSPKTTFSVLEGVGRTLKGRDLRQVRNAVWRKTGFLDS